MQAPFEDLVTAHGHTVLRVARALAGPDDADDVWSETFLAAMRAYPALSHDANTQAWLVTIAHRKAIDVLRARSRRAVPMDPAMTSRHVPDGAPEERLDLYAAVSRLPRKQRQAVVLHHLGGLPYAEVADQVGGTPQAARRAGADGVAALRHHLAKTSRRADEP